MAVQQAARAPYASTGSIIKVIEKHRQMGLQTISLQRLQQIGVTEPLAPRTLQALIFLGFYDDNGDVTPEFDALRKVPEHDFKPYLADLLRKAYAPILEVLTPATASPMDVENAFRGFEPTGQLSRMVQLFMGLMIYVDLMPEDRRKPSTGGGRPPGSRSTSGASGRKSAATAGGGVGTGFYETPAETPPSDENPPGAGFTQTDANTFILKLPSGPEMTLMVRIDVMRASVADRNFIFKIIDELREYNAEPKETSGQKAAGEKGDDAEDGA
jgi:Family of unknown function (DUF5343)